MERSLGISVAVKLLETPFLGITVCALNGYLAGADFLTGDRFPFR
jgi:hypothetical protein